MSDESVSETPREIIEKRIEYLENYTPRDRAHEESLNDRKRELEIVLNRITGEDP